jgi:hypothetical protein
MSIALHYKVKEMDERIAQLERELRAAKELFEKQLCTLPTDEPRRLVGLDNLIARVEALEVKRKPGRPPKETADGRQPANRGH